MEEMGFVSAPDGNKPRRILITREEFEEKRMNAGE
jgi:DNA segregation ATPase FtsK/SpoIIIE-like protein